MKKWSIALSILVVVAVTAYLGYRYYVPKAIAEAISSEEGSSIMPEKVQKKVKDFKVKVDENIEKLPELMEDVKIEYEDLLVIIDELDADEFFIAYDELKLREWDTTDDVFNIALKHISLEGYDLEKFRNTFNSNASVQKIEQWMKIIEDNELLTSMSIPVAKETAKRVLESKKEKILQKLEE